MAGEDTPVTNDLTAAEQAMLDKLAGALSGITATSSSSGNTNTSNVSTSVTKLTYNSAKAMLEQAAQEAGYPKQFTAAEINEYIKQFNAKQKEQIARVVTIASQKTTPGADAAAVNKVFEQTAREEYPSFFKPLEFATDFIWGKVNFKDDTTLGSAVTGNLATVRGLVDKFHIVGLIDSDIQRMALEISKGDKTLNEITVDIQQAAVKEYPQFAERFKADPTLTTEDIAKPVIDTLASVWEMDKKDIKWDNPIVMKWVNGNTADGKSVQPTKYEIMLAAKKDPKYQYTQAANNDARDAAVAMTNALGVGI